MERRSVFITAPEPDWDVENFVDLKLHLQSALHSNSWSTVYIVDSTSAGAGPIYYTTDYLNNYDD